MAASAERVVSLDLIRGVAVLGILTVNIAGFAGPSAATLTPHAPHAAHPAGPIDEAAFAAVFLLFEGKMRALFTMLFGASLLLFIDRAEARGRNGELLQLRRLCWLLVFGLLHYFLFWWGDILFIYAVAGIIALYFRHMPPVPMLVAALLAYAGWHVLGMLASLPDIATEEHVRLGLANAAEIKDQGEFLRAFAARAASEVAEYRLGFADQVIIKATERPFWLIQTTWPSLGETLPLMLVGMVLLRSGFFAGDLANGGWPRRWLVRLAVAGGAVGTALTLGLLAWVWPRHFPPRAMSIALLYAAALPHLLMALAYAALLVLATPRLAATRLGRRLIAAGRMAFTNYIATTVVMTAIFYGWGLGLGGRIGHAAQLLFVLLGWTLMLAWSEPWLARFRQGPLEWLWRSLIEWRRLPLRRPLACAH